MKYDLRAADSERAASTMARTRSSTYTAENQRSSLPKKTFRPFSTSLKRLK